MDIRLQAILPNGSRRPACPGTQRRCRFFGFVHDLRMIECSEFARLAQNAAVYDHGVDVGRLSQRDNRFTRIPDRRHVDIGGAHQDDVSPLAGS
jgi:hypothetical protein